MSDRTIEWRNQPMKDEKKQKKEVLKKEMERLGSLQRECKEEKIPVYLLFDGYDGAGKGVQIGKHVYFRVHGGVSPRDKQEDGRAEHNQSVVQGVMYDFI